MLSDVRDLLVEEIVERCWAPHDLVEDSNLSREEWQKLLTADLPMDQRVAEALSEKFGISAQLWMNIATSERRP